VSSVTAHGTRHSALASRLGTRHARRQERHGTAHAQRSHTQPEPRTARFSPTSRRSRSLCPARVVSSLALRGSASGARTRSRATAFYSRLGPATTQVTEGRTCGARLTGGRACHRPGTGPLFVVYECNPCVPRLLQLDARHLTQGPVAFAEELLKGLGRLGLEPEGARALVLATAVTRLLFCDGVWGWGMELEYGWRWQ